MPAQTHGVWASDPAWAHPANGAAVSSWRNQSGGGDPAQAAGSLQPVYRASTAAFNNRPTVQFDGVDDFLRSAITTLVQPFKVVIVGSISAGQLWVGGFNNASPDLGFGRSGGSHWYEHCGSILEAAGASDGNAHVYQGTANGVSSSVTVDGVSQVTGAAGATGLVNFALGGGYGSGGTTAHFAAGHIAFAGIYAGTVPDASLAALARALGVYYGILVV